MYKFIQLDESEALIINGGETLFYDIGKALGYGLGKLWNFISNLPSYFIQNPPVGGPPNIYSRYIYFI